MGNIDYYHERFQKAAHILEILRSRCMQRNIMEKVFEIDILHAAICYALGDRDRAKGIMEQALNFSETEGYVLFSS